MDRFNKNDIIKIINTKDFWENKKGIVIDDSEDEIITNEDIDLTPVTVKIKFTNDENEEKATIQIFPRCNLEISSSNENLNEYFSSTKFDTEEKFKNFFLEQPCKFTGFDYKSIFKVDSKGEFNKDDLAVINEYQKLKKIDCVILDCAIIDGFDPENTTEDNFNGCFWDLKFDNDVVLKAIPGESIKLKNVEFEQLNESLNKIETDYIKDYIYQTDWDDNEIASWFFADKLATAENVKVDEVIKLAKKLKYKLYRLRASNFNKIIIAAPKCDIEVIYDDYADYLQGKVTLEEI